jgi:hypothetical protein
MHIHQYKDTMEELVVLIKVAVVEVQVVLVIQDHLLHL